MKLPVLTELVRDEGDSINDVEDLLEGKVFHVTSLPNWELILKSGSIAPNSDGQFTNTFGSKNSFFRNRSCVSVFDYRVKPPEDNVDYRHRCHPLQPARPDTPGVAILFLHPVIYPKLLSWKLCRDEVMCRERVVPYVEAGHPGPISISFIENVIYFRRTENENSFAAIIRRSMQSNDTKPQ
jgi:hypothetical protein